MVVFHVRVYGLRLVNLNGERCLRSSYGHLRTRNHLIMCWKLEARVKKACVQKAGLRTWLIFAVQIAINPLNPELNPICHLLALLGDHHIVYVSRIRVKLYDDHGLANFKFKSSKS